MELVCLRVLGFALGFALGLARELACGFAEALVPALARDLARALAFVPLAGRLVELWKTLTAFSSRVLSDFN